MSITLYVSYVLIVAHRTSLCKYYMAGTNFHSTVMAENIYQMYVANGNKAGFLVQRNSWSWQTALITSIGGQAEGELEGLPPYFKNQKVKGRMGGAGREIDISCPGTYGYCRVDQSSP